MATTKNITMKQFNGTDYDTLYPKTDVKQVENLTPSSIGAVAKTGDTMTGNLVVPTLNVAQNVSAGYIYGETNALNIRGGNPNTGTMHYLQIKDSGVYVDNNLVCHEGNLEAILEANGFCRIQKVSRVGTGTYTESDAPSVTFSFAPKFVVLADFFGEESDIACKAVAMDLVGTSRTSGKGFCGNTGNAYYAKKSTDGKTLYWWGHEGFIYNDSGETYILYGIG